MLRVDKSAIKMASQPTPAPKVSIYGEPLGLDSIRLITLEPGEANDPILIRLSTFCTRDAPEYDAISYVWGDPSSKRTIVCDGRPVAVTANLQWALRRARNRMRPYHLWADALCINQTDLAERSQQVAIMGHTYAAARRVLVCLGPDGAGKGARELMMLLAEHAPFGSVDGAAKEALWTDWRWRSLSAALRRPWFNRVWVLQEVGLARDPRVLYGEAEFAYRDLMAAVRWVVGHAAHLISRFNIMTHHIHTLWAEWSGGGNGRFTFLDLLDHGTLLSCQDPRDRIYAFLGHPLALRDDGKPIIIPDYGKETLEVYKTISMALLQTHGPRVLASVEHSSETLNEDFPSWVVRWNMTFKANNIWTSVEDPHQASHGWSQEVVDCFESDRLRMQGVVADVIESVYDVVLFMGNERIGFRARKRSDIISLEEMVHILETADGEACSCGPKRAEMLASSLCASFDLSDDVATAEAFAIYRHKSHGSDWKPWKRPASLSPKHEGLANAFWGSAKAMCPGRVFITTRRGHCGLAPFVVETGDLCCVLRGADVPFVLRRCWQPEAQKVENGEFRMLGEAFVCGIMHGEAVELIRSKELDVETLTIW